MSSSGGGNWEGVVAGPSNSNSNSKAHKLLHHVYRWAWMGALDFDWISSGFLLLSCPHFPFIAFCCPCAPAAVAALLPRPPPKSPSSIEHRHRQKRKLSPFFHNGLMRFRLDLRTEMEMGVLVAARIHPT